MLFKFCALSCEIVIVIRMSKFWGRLFDAFSASSEADFDYFRVYFVLST